MVSDATPNARTQKNLWLTAGVLAFLGAIGAMGADIASGWSAIPNSTMETALSLQIEDISPLLLVKSHEALIWGHYAALAFIPLGMLGIWHVAHLLKPAGRVWSLTFLLAGIFTYTAGTAYHMTYGFVATVLQYRDPALTERIAPFFEPFGTVIVLAVVLTMLPLVGAVLTGNTHYPRWFAILTPLPLQLALSAAAAISPPAVANFLIVTGLNASMAIFFGLSLMTTAPKVMVAEDTRTAA